MAQSIHNMADPIEKYLDEVMRYAGLCPHDEKSVRSELVDHLRELARSSGLSKPEEVFTMLKDQFGNPGKIGRAIAAGKGRFKTYLKKQQRKWPRYVAALVLAFAVRSAVAQVFYAAGSAAEPMVPKGSRVFVYKLSHNFQPGDVVVFRRADGVALLGVVISQNAARDLVVSRKGSANENVPHELIVGRVFLNTR
jgi:hypothetical protein